MRILKSPVFYFGIALLLTVCSALLAPFVVDWGRYRGGLEAWGQKLTGRDVAIRGDIAVRLFPFPQLTAQDVVIANPDGFREPVFASIEQVKVQVTLGGLINGDLQVESIDIEKPVASLVRMQGNEVNWLFTPAVSVRNSRLLDQVQLDQIKVNGGTVYLIDEVRDTRSLVSGINATLAAPSLAGPWRSTGSFEGQGRALSYSLSTARVENEKPLRFSLRLSPADQAGYSATIEGESNFDGRLTGDINIGPVVDAEGKSDTEGNLRAVTMKARYAASFETIDLQDIEIRPADSKDQGTLITAKANASIGRQIKASVEISAPRIDADALTGAQSRQLLRDGGGLALINGLFMALPSDLQLAARLKVLSLRMGGELLDNTELAFETAPDQVSISRFSANLPGRSRMLFSGVFLPGQRLAELGGRLNVESLDLRQLSMWLVPDSKATLQKVWTGERGRLKAESDVKLTASKLEFSNLAYELNGDAGTARLSMLVNGERPILDLELKAERLDVDALMPDGVASFPENGGMQWNWLLQGFMAQQSRQDMRLVMSAQKLLLNGVDAENVTADIETTVRGIDVKGLSIASVGGAKVEASGLILNGDAGPDGDVTFSVAAEDPRGLLRLAGLVPRDATPGWTSVLGATSMKIMLQARAGMAAGSLGLSLDGRSGPFAIKADGELSQAADNRLGFAGQGGVSSQTSAALWRLLGGSPQGVEGGEASLTFNIANKPGQPVQARAAARLYGAAIEFNGTANPFGSARSAQGALTFAAENALVFAQAAGLPLVEGAALPVSAKAELQVAGDALTLTKLAGMAGGEPIEGELSFSGRTLKGNLGVARVSLAQALAAAFLPWNGEAASLESLFAPEAPFGLTGELWLKPRALEVYPGFLVPDGQIGITAKPKSLDFVAYGKGPNGEKVSVDLKLDASLAQRKLTAAVALPLQLNNLLAGSDGSRPVSGVASFDVKAEGEGLSPAAVMSSLTGKGAFQLNEVVLREISPDEFSARIAGVKDSEALTAALQSMRGGKGIAFAPMFGAADVRQGVATITPFTLTGSDATVTVSPVVDLTQGRLRIPVSLDLKAVPGLPRMTITYSGAPKSLERRQDASELTAFLGFKVLQQGVDELVRVQAEQERLAREEEELRKADEQKLEQFYAQRAELRLRQRELRILAAQRQLDAAEREKQLDERVAAARPLVKEELARRVRELAVFGRPLSRTPAVVPRPKPATGNGVQSP